MFNVIKGVQRRVREEKKIKKKKIMLRIISCNKRKNLPTNVDDKYLIKKIFVFVLIIN